MSALVRYPRAVAAELVRTRRSASARFALVGLAVAVLQGLGWSTVATRELTGWGQLVAWQAVYATALFAPLTALLVGLTVNRERSAREGGTLWRPLTARVGFAARGTVLALQLLGFNAALTLPVLLIGLAHGLPGPPVARVTALWLVLWLCALLPAVISLVVAQFAGLYAAVGLALVWQIAGTVTAESAAGAWQPWAWQVRASLPLVGIHFNGTALEPDSPIWHWDPLWPTLYSLTLTLIVAAVIALLPNRSVSVRPRSRPWSVAATAAVATEHMTGASHPVVKRLDGRVPRGRPHRVAGIVGSLRRTALPWLVVSTVLVLLLIGMVWNAGYVRGFTTWVLLPFGTCLFACLAWMAQRDAWRILVLRARPHQLAGHLLAAGAVLVVLVVLETVLLVAARGDASLTRFGIVAAGVGLAWLLVCLWLATRYGIGAAVGATLIVLVFSLVFASTEFARSNLWLLGVLGWPASATTWPRVGQSILLCAAIATAAACAWLRALRAAARR